MSQSQTVDDDVSVQEALIHIKGRPVSWVVVVLAIAGVIAAGVALIEALPWLFFVGLGVIVFSVILGMSTHALADTSAKVETPARLAVAAPPSAVGGELPSGAAEPARP